MTDAATNVASFEAFLERWMVRQKDDLDELISAQNRGGEMRDDDRRDLISRVLSHYQEYFEEKSRIAHRDILLVFSPTWFSSLERSFLWIAGFKPRMMIQLANETVEEDLSEEQRRMMSEIGNETRMEERELNDELAKIHESVAAAPVVEAARSHGRLGLSERVIAGGGGGGGEVARTVKIALENVVGNADALRINTALKLMKVLEPYQAINVLIAVAQLLIRIRTLGFQKDAQQQGGD